MSPASTRTTSPTFSPVEGTSLKFCRSAPLSSFAWVSLRCRAQRIGLRLAAAFGDRFGEVREQHGEPQPQDDLELEAGCVRRRVTRSRIRMTVVRAVTTSSTNITGFFISVRGLSLTKAEPIAGTDDLRIEERRYRHAFAQG